MQQNGRAYARRAALPCTAPMNPSSSGLRTARWAASAWMATQFQQMKARIERLSGQVERLSKVAVDNVEQEQLEQLREKLAIAEESLALLENDASRVALPRKYRR